MKTYLLKAGVRNAIAKAGETDIAVAYNAKAWMDEYPAGNPQLMVTTPGGKRVPVTVEAVDNLITGQVPNELLAGPGVYSYVFVWTSGSTQLESGRCECLVLGSNLAKNLAHDSRRTPDWAERIFLAAEVIEGAIPGMMEARNTTADNAAEAKTAAEAAAESESAAADSAEAAAASEENIDTILTNMEQTITDATAAMNGIEEQKNTMIASIASVAGQGTDTTLTQSGVAADAKAAGDQISDLKSAVAQLASEENLTSQYISGGYINLSVAVGNTVDIETITSSTIRYYIVVPCKAGEWFVVSGTGGTNPRLWGVLDSNKKLLSVADAESVETNTIISISQDGYFVSNVYKSDEYSLMHYYFDAIEQISDVKESTEEVDNKVSDLIDTKNVYLDLTTITYEKGGMYTTGAKNDSAANTIRNIVDNSNPAPFGIAGSVFSCDTGYTMRVCVYSAATGIGANNLIKRFDGDSSSPIETDIDGYFRWAITSPTTTDTDTEAGRTALASHIHVQLIVAKQYGRLIVDEKRIDKLETVKNNYTELVAAQSYVSEDWHFPFINVWQNMGLGSAHQIPNTASLWTTGTTDLDQKGIWMQDGIHPFKGAGVTPMYARTIVDQLKMVCPSYRDAQGQTDTDPVDWTGRTLLWMGTSIPAGSDPSAGSGTGSTYPAMVAAQLGATCINKAKGSSCLRINASTGEYTGMKYDHFIRSVTRTVAECDLIASDWSNIYPKLVGAPSTLSAADLQEMKDHSFENLLLPNIDGTSTTPDLWVIDYGHNDVRPRDIYGNQDTYIRPTVENIESGLLADDEYMTANNYANLKTAFNSTLSGITDLQSFSASVNRNCFIGACNFLITLIMSYNPYARIIIVSDYN